MKLDSSVTVGGLGILLGFIVLLIMPAQIEGHQLLTMPEVRNPAFFPTLISIFLIVVGSLLSYRGLLGKVQPGQDQVWPEQPFRVLLTTVVILAYTGLIFIVGFYPASVMLIAVLAPVLGYRNPVGIAVAALGTTLLIYIMFERSLNVFLPGSAGM